MNENTEFKPTTSWMAEKYNELNQKYFNGELGKCYFVIFTKGKGSEGKSLGQFSMQGEGLSYLTFQRQLYVQGDDMRNIYINRENFFELAKPTIGLNGNYSGPEYCFLSTLIHEMCHYYTFMDGFVNKGHGNEFYEIGDKVSERSNGLFTVERLASAEDVSKLKLDDKIIQRKLKRENTKKQKITALFIYRTDGFIGLTTTSNDALIKRIENLVNNDDVFLKIVKTNDINVINAIFDYGFKQDVKKIGCWRINIDEHPNIFIALRNADKTVLNRYTMNEQYLDMNINKIITEVINKLRGNKKKGKVINIPSGINLSDMILP